MREAIRCNEGGNQAEHGAVLAAHAHLMREAIRCNEGCNQAEHNAVLAAHAHLMRGGNQVQ